MILCENCLTSTDEVRKVPVGHDQGTQRDPYRVERMLCVPCAGALVGGRWDLLHERYSDTRTVRRGE